MRHKHADVIIAWANGAKVQFRNMDYVTDWEELDNPSFYDEYEYRVKPEPKPDVVKYLGFVNQDGHAPGYLSSDHYCVNHWDHQIKLTFDGETGKLKSAEVIK